MNRKKTWLLGTTLLGSVPLLAYAASTMITPELTNAMAQVLTQQSSGNAPNPAASTAVFVQRFPATPVGNALGLHVMILTDVTAGADARRITSLAALRVNAQEASQGLLDA